MNCLLWPLLLLRTIWFWDFSCWVTTSWTRVLLNVLNLCLDRCFLNELGRLLISYWIISHALKISYFWYRLNIVHLKILRVEFINDLRFKLRTHHTKLSKILKVCLKLVYCIILKSFWFLECKWLCSSIHNRRLMIILVLSAICAVLLVVVWISLYHVSVMILNSWSTLN